MNRGLYRIAQAPLSRRRERDRPSPARFVTRCTGGRSRPRVKRTVERGGLIETAEESDLGKRELGRRQVVLRQREPRLPQQIAETHPFVLELPLKRARATETTRHVLRPRLTRREALEQQGPHTHSERLPRAPRRETPLQGRLEGRPRRLACGHEFAHGVFASKHQCGLARYDTRAYLAMSAFICRARPNEHAIEKNPSFWMLASLMYASILAQPLASVLFEVNRKVVSLDQHDWWTSDVYGSSLLMTFWTALPLTLFATLKIRRALARPQSS